MVEIVKYIHMLALLKCFMCRNWQWTLEWPVLLHNAYVCKTKKPRHLHFIHWQARSVIRRRWGTVKCCWCYCCNCETNHGYVFEKIWIAFWDGMSIISAWMVCPWLWKVLYFWLSCLIHVFLSVAWFQEILALQTIAFMEYSTFTKYSVSSSYSDEENPKVDQGEWQGEWDGKTPCRSFEEVCSACSTCSTSPLRGWTFPQKRGSFLDKIVAPTDGTR